MELEVLQKAIGDLGAEVKKSTEETGKLIQMRDAEIKQIGKTTEETGKLVGEAGKRLEELKSQYDSMRKQVDEIEAKANRIGSSGSREEILNPAQIFVGSDAYKSMVKAGKRSSDVVDIKSFHFEIDKKSLSSDSASAGALVDPFRFNQIQKNPDRPMRIRDLLTVSPISSSSAEFPQETGFANIAAELTSQANSAQAVLVVENSIGFFVGQTVKIGTGGTQETKIILTVDSETQITLTTNLANNQAVGKLVTGTTFIGTPEGKTKPKMNLTFELVNNPVRTLAHWIPVTNQILADAPQLQAYINQRLGYGLGLVEEEQILYGSGSGETLQGITTHPDVQTYSWSAGVPGDTKLDAIRRAINLSRVAQFPVDGVVLHSDDWTDIELTKGEDGHYIWTAAPSEGAGMRVWRTPVIETTAVVSGDFVVGAWKMAAMLWDRMQSTIRVAEQHADFFVRNMVAVLAEERVALSIFRPEGFVAGTFDSAPVEA